MNRDGILAVAKPPGVAVHATRDPQRPHVLGLLAKWLQASGDSGHLGLVHRLDVETSGVLLLCRDRALEAQLGRAFAQRRVHKTYVAVCQGQPSQVPPLIIANYLKAERVAGVERMRAVRSGGEAAQTVLAAALTGAGSGSLILARPATGRRHQIRAHLAGVGLPIQGDRLYGAAPTAAVPRIMLHALQLQLDHPQSGEHLTLKADLPDDWLAAAERATGQNATQVRAWLANCAAND